jgi:hypothetical protein
MNAAVSGTGRFAGSNGIGPDAASDATLRGMERAQPKG